MLYGQRSVRLAVLLVVALVVPSNSLTIGSSLRPAASASLRASSIYLQEAAEQKDCACPDTDGELATNVAGVVVPTEFKGVTMNDVRVSGATLRSTELVNARGTRETIGNVIGADGKAVVVFLRHLG